MGTIFKSLLAIILCTSAVSISLTTLIVGTAQNIYAQGSSFSHTVKKGESLYGLSRLYGVEIGDIKRNNDHIKGMNLMVGQKLKIPYAKLGSEAKPVAPTYFVDDCQSPYSFVYSVNGHLDDAIPKICYEEDVPTHTDWEKLVSNSPFDNRPFNYAAECITETNDGGFVLSGYRSKSLFDAPQLWIAKLDRGGDWSWENTFDNGSGSCIAPLSDGGFVLAAANALIRTNEIGKKKWKKNVQNIRIRQILATDDQKIAILSDEWLFKLTENGNEIWKTRFGNQKQANAVIELNNGNFAVAGKKEDDSGSSNMWLGIIRADGSRVFEETYGGEYLDNAYDIAQTSDGNLVLAGFSMLRGDECTTSYCESSVYLVKVDLDGNKIWSSTYAKHVKRNNSCIKIHNTAKRIVEMSNGHLLVAAETSTDKSKLWLIRTDPNGNIVWNEETNRIANDVVKTADNGFILAGWKHDEKTQKDGAWLVKYKGSGHYYESNKADKARKKELESTFSFNKKKKKKREKKEKPKVVKNKPKPSPKPTPKPPVQTVAAKLPSPIIKQETKSRSIDNAGFIGTPSVGKGKNEQLTFVFDDGYQNTEKCTESYREEPPKSPSNSTVSTQDKATKNDNFSPIMTGQYSPIKPPKQPSIVPMPPKQPSVFSTNKPDLHILTIGTNPPDLQFATKDAEDFANAFKKQGSYLGTGNKLFNKVNINKLTGTKANTKSIEAAVERLYFQYTQGQIHDDDVLVLFISSHGFIHQNRFRIEGSDFDYSSPVSTSVAYEDIVNYLASVPCKKLIFIDACHSGSSEVNFASKASVSVINHYIQQLSNYQSGLTTITSSGKDQQSYEDRRSRNGFFTKAILQAFKGKADSNKDDIITIDELSTYLVQKVPKIVGEETGKLQHPQIIRNDLATIPIYVVK